MAWQQHDSESIMACPAVRLSVAIRRPVRVLRIGDGAVRVLGRPCCSDEEECEYREGPSCLLPMVRGTPTPAPDA